MNSLYKGILLARCSRHSSLRFLLQQSSSITSSASEAAVYHNSEQPKSPSQHFPASSSDWPRPKEIPFQSKVANCVNLIGYVSEPIQFQASPDNKFWAATVITQHHHHPSSSQSPPHFKIPIIFEDDLAHTAASHLKLHDRIYITGKLSADPPPINVLHGEVRFLILAHNINFIQGSSQIRKNYGLQEEEEDFLSKQQDEKRLKHFGSTTKNGDLLNSWRDLVHNPKQWWDYRSSKLNGSANPKHPDFKRKDGSSALWLDRAPGWILSELEKMELDEQIPNSKQVKQHKGDEYWKDLVDNPNKWWDNRVNKRNVRAPDFKHKETGVGLWLTDSPTWVIPKLPPLKSDQNVVASHKEAMFS